MINDFPTVALMAGAELMCSCEECVACSHFIILSFRLVNS